jgi:hypothetical protein
MGADFDFLSSSPSVGAVSKRWWNQLKAAKWALTSTSCRRRSVSELFSSAGGCKLKVAEWALTSTSCRCRSVSELFPCAGISSRPPNGR